VQAGTEWEIVAELEARTACAPIGGDRTPTPDTVIVRDPSPAPTCQVLAVSSGLRLAPSDGGGRPDPGPDAITLSSGTLLTTADVVAGAILSWNDDGSPLGVYERRGDGPGELSIVGGAPGVILRPGAGDTLFVLDSRSRWSVFEWDQQASELRFARTFRDPAAVLDHRYSVATSRGIVRSRSAQGGRAAVELLDEHGNAAVQFPVSGGPRAVANTRGATVWIAPEDGSFAPLVFEEWTLDGERVRTIERRASWYAPPERSGAEGAHRAYHLPSISLHVDDLGLLWVGVAVPTPEISRGAASEPAGSEGQIEVHFEVIDPEAGTVLAAYRIDPFAWEEALPPFTHFLADSRRSYRSVRDAVGHHTLEFFDLHLVER
jgi:hypothetical protein